MYAIYHLSGWYILERTEDLTQRSSCLLGHRPDFQVILYDNEAWAQADLKTSYCFIFVLIQQQNSFIQN